jgi:Bacterial regulatory proteins, luxR family
MTALAPSYTSRRMISSAAVSSRAAGQPVRTSTDWAVSPKTASVHVSNILAKLGVAGRVEAAAAAHRLGAGAPRAESC